MTMLTDTRTEHLAAISRNVEIIKTLLIVWTAVGGLVLTIMVLSSGVLWGG
jgi:hypothetical protein